MMPYLIAKICYDPSRPEYPWYVIRSGTVAEQGGLAIGTESVSFQTIEDVTNYLSSKISKDIDTIQDLIKKRSEILENGY